MAVFVNAATNLEEVLNNSAYHAYESGSIQISARRCLQPVEVVNGPSHISYVATIDVHRTESLAAARQSDDA
eukprot:5064120-Lingulodinium_polyedra.AAC.1